MIYFKSCCYEQFNHFFLEPIFRLYDQLAGATYFVNHLVVMNLVCYFSLMNKHGVKYKISFGTLITKFW